MKERRLFHDRSKGKKGVEDFRVRRGRRTLEVKGEGKKKTLNIRDGRHRKKEKNLIPSHDTEEHRRKKKKRESPSTRMSSEKKAFTTIGRKEKGKSRISSYFKRRGGREEFCIEEKKNTSEEEKRKRKGSEVLNRAAFCEEGGMISYSEGRTERGGRGFDLRMGRA